jgi:hypothetical protein
MALVRTNLISPSHTRRASSAALAAKKVPRHHAIGRPWDGVATTTRARAPSRTPNWLIVQLLTH